MITKCELDIETKQHQIDLNQSLLIQHVVGIRGIEQLIQSRDIDCLIIECEDGFSQLGMMRSMLSNELAMAQRNLVKYVLDGFPEDLERNISSLADWCRSNSDVTFVAIPSNNSKGQLKGLILAPYDSCNCYKKFSVREFIKPYRDFMYNVSYETINYAHKHWGVKDIAITHLSRCKISGEYDSDTTTCQLEAALHYTNENSGLNSLTFLDEHIGNTPISLLDRLIRTEPKTKHRPIKTSILNHIGVDFVNLQIPAPNSPITFSNPEQSS